MAARHPPSSPRAVAIAGVAAVVLAGCGGGGGPRSAPVVARVAGTAISVQTLAHWMVPKRRELQRSASGTAPSDAAVREAALRFLITSQWLQQEATAQGVSVTRREAESSYERLLDGPAGGAFAASLTRRGLSRDDELLVLRIGELADRLRAHVMGPQHGLATPAARARLKQFIAGYRQRWRQRTTCAPGYVISDCANGRAP